jgi:TPR repeat protein
LLTLLIISALPQTVLSRTETDHQACQQLFDNARYSEASSPCQKAAQAGDVNAQTLLGELYDGGLGIDQNAALAKKWWQAAVDQRHVPAINLLALKFYYGGTVFGREAGWEQGYPKAMALWRLSAEE